MSDWTNLPRPLSIAHRGASAYAPDCSLEAFEKAARLGADMWEVDIRLAACGTLIAFHDAAFPDGQAIADLTLAEIAQEAKTQGVPAAPFAEVVALAKRLGAGIYADIKDLAATVPAMALLRDAGIEKAILGAFDPEAARLLQAADSPYPRSALVPPGVDPFTHAAGADIIHLCWEKLDRPQDLLDEAFFAECERRGQKVVLWHEEDPRRMAALREKPVLGICSDRPELVNPWTPPADWPVDIVCHRGACEFAPENTLAAMHCALAAGFQFVEFDLHDTADGGVVLFHDGQLNRTTNGTGATTWASLETFGALDAGSWYAPQFRHERVPEFRQVLDLLKSYDAQAYVELKYVDPARVLEEVRLAGALERCFFWSFDYPRLAALRAQEPEARIMMRRGDFTDMASLLALNPWVIEFGPDAEPDDLAEARAAGARVMIAYMGQDTKVFDKIRALRPDMVNLHHPFLFRDTLAMVPLGS